MKTEFITLTDATGALAVVAPQLGGWLLRYARSTPGRGLVEALHFEQAVVDRYPNEMWAGNPILFPLVSHNRVGNRAHHYEWNGRVFPLPQHGFARRVPWTVCAQSDSALTMEITDTPVSRGSYPFRFKHRFTYRLNGGRLEWEQVVENRDEMPMPFSTGVHPYIDAPLTSQGSRADCYVEIPDASLLKPVGEFDSFESSPFAAQHWSVAHDVAGTMFLGDLAKRELALVDPASDLRVVLNWEDSPQHCFVAIWSRATDAPFYCLEPWTALPNSFARANGELILLQPGQTFRAAMWMDVRPVG